MNGSEWEILFEQHNRQREHSLHLLMTDKIDLYLFIDLLEKMGYPQYDKE